MPPELTLYPRLIYPQKSLCPLSFKKHSMKQCLYGRARTGESRYRGLLKLHILAVEEGQPGQQGPVQRNALVGKQKRFLDETERAWSHNCHGTDCRNHGFLVEQEKGLGKWVTDDPGIVDTEQGHQCSFDFLFCFIFALFSSPSYPQDSMGRRLGESVSSTFHFLESPFQLSACIPVFCPPFYCRI